MTAIHQNPTFLSEQILQLIFFQITPSKVRDILQILKLEKKSGLDSISHQMLQKRVIPSMFLSLYCLMYRCLNQNAVENRICDATLQKGRQIIDIQL